MPTVTAVIGPAEQAALITALGQVITALITARLTRPPQPPQPPRAPRKARRKRRRRH